MTNRLAGSHDLGGTSAFLLLLLLGDAAFAALHIALRATPWLHDEMFSLAKDGGYPEMYQYVKELWIVALLVWLCWRRHWLGFFAWALLFGYLLLDDSLQLHEHLGGALSARLGLHRGLGLRPQDFGELIFSAAVAGPLLALVGWFQWRAGETLRRVGWRLVRLLAVLIFFGVFMDMAHQALGLGWRGKQVFEFLEDGGEMLAMSLIAACVFHLALGLGDMRPATPWSTAVQRGR